MRFLGVSAAGACGRAGRVHPVPARGYRSQQPRPPPGTSPGARPATVALSQRDGPDRCSATLRRFPPHRRRCPPAAFRDTRDSRDTRDIRGPGARAAAATAGTAQAAADPPGCQPGQHAARQAALTPQETHPCDPVAVPVPASGLLCYHHDGALPWSEQRRWSIAVVVQGRRMGSAGNDGAGVTNGTGTAAGRRPTPPRGQPGRRPTKRLTRPCPRRRLGSRSRRPYLTRFRRGWDVCPAWRLETRRTATAQQSLPFIPADTPGILEMYRIWKG